MTLQPWTDDDLAYAAGFIDGEGCISLFQRGTSYKPVVSCSNTNKPVIEWFKATFGGSACKQRRLRKANHRPMYSWCIVSRDADRFCKAVLPFLKQKAEQALIIVAVQQLTGKAKSNARQSVLEQRAWFKHRIAECKRPSWD